jgi:FKBP-type peptidyl-prolyl cis-trans isomerase
VALGEPELPVIVEMVSGMRIGGKRRVLLPPSAELSPESGNEIRADDTIRFDVEVRGQKDK